MANTSGMNGTALTNNSDIGWSGIEVSKYAKPFLENLSTMRNALWRHVKAKGMVISEMLSNMITLISENASESIE